MRQAVRSAITLTGRPGFVEEEAVAELRVVAVRIEQGVGPVCLCLGRLGAGGRAMANTAFDTPRDLDRMLRRELCRIQLQPRLIDGCLTATRLTVEPPDSPGQPE
ncbi:hypothetical protein LRE75_08350 [Streptomyces sp. 372A]